LSSGSSQKNVIFVKKLDADSGDGFDCTTTAAFCLESFARFGLGTFSSKKIKVAMMVKISFKSGRVDERPSGDS
jgi:hypothetical protein